jgi:hypothetical protein
MEFILQEEPSEEYDSGRFGEHRKQSYRRALTYLVNIKQQTLVAGGNHDVIVYTMSSLYLAPNLPNARLILHPDANRGSWQGHTSSYPEDFTR